jgi:hypothetical protein
MVRPDLASTTRCRRCVSSSTRTTRSRAEPPWVAPRRRIADLRRSAGSHSLQPGADDDSARRPCHCASRGRDGRGRGQPDCRTGLQGGPPLGVRGGTSDRPGVCAASVRVWFSRSVHGPRRYDRRPRGRASRRDPRGCWTPRCTRASRRRPVLATRQVRRLRWPGGAPRRIPTGC